MSWQAFQRSALLAPVCSFVAACSLLSIFWLACAAQLIDSLAWQVALGQIISLMLLTLGNFLPKLRPLHGTRIARSDGANAERLAGRALVLAGVVSFALFIRAPLVEAKVGAAWLGFGTLMMIGCHWGWLGYTSRSPAAEAACTAPERRITLSLLVAYGYLFICAWTLALVGDAPAHRDLRAWLLTGLSLLLSIVFATFEPQPRNRCRARLGLE